MQHVAHLINAKKEVTLVCPYFMPLGKKCKITQVGQIKIL
jgi:hypothetical protein